MNVDPYIPSCESTFQETYLFLKQKKKEVDQNETAFDVYVIYRYEEW